MIIARGIKNEPIEEYNTYPGSFVSSQVVSKGKNKTREC